MAVNKVNHQSQVGQERQLINSCLLGAGQMLESSELHPESHQPPERTGGDHLPGTAVSTCPQDNEGVHGAPAHFFKHASLAKSSIFQRLLQMNVYPVGDGCLICISEGRPGPVCGFGPVGACALARERPCWDQQSLLPPGKRWQARGLVPAQPSSQSPVQWGSELLLRGLCLPA